MAYGPVLASTSPLTSSKLSFSKTHLKTSPNRSHFLTTQNPKPLFNRSLTFQNSHPPSPNPSNFPQFVAVSDANPDGLFDVSKEEAQIAPVKFAIWVLVWASLSIAWFAVSGDAEAASDSIKASSFGLRVASGLRSSGWPDGAVVFALATLPVIELRGAIPVGYWMQLKPVVLTVLAVLGNMVPVPFIILYLKKLATFLAGKNQSASRLLDLVFKRAKEKAGPVEEFQWLGLMLFVAVPFPGTGAWSGAIIASVLDMPFWHALSANFFGVVLAGLLVNLLVNLGLRYAIFTGIALFFVSTFMWSILRSVKKSLSSSN